MARVAQSVLGRGNHVLASLCWVLTFCLHRDSWVWLDGWPCSKLPELHVSLGRIPVMKSDSTTQICSPAQHYVNEGADEKENYIYLICPFKR